MARPWKQESSARGKGLLHRRIACELRDEEGLNPKAAGPRGHRAMQYALPHALGGATTKYTASHKTRRLSYRLPQPRKKVQQALAFLDAQPFLYAQILSW
jgi:hypothetical protein